VPRHAAPDGRACGCEKICWLSVAYSCPSTCDALTSYGAAKLAVDAREATVVDVVGRGVKMIVSPQSDGRTAEGIGQHDRGIMMQEPSIDRVRQPTRLIKVVITF